MHLHASFLDFLVTVAYLIVFGLIWRSTSARWSERPIGRAMAFIY